MRIYHTEIPSRTLVAIQSEATFGFTNIFQTTKISSIYWNGIFTLNKFFPPMYALLYFLALVYLY
nr:MAG TPA: hypothetical protein [Bacteriophage sp.]